MKLLYVARVYASTAIRRRWEANIRSIAPSSTTQRAIPIAIPMAKSKYEYVKQFELDDKLLPECWIVIRVDGRGFTR